jgi:RimJ/RimL family protein N-acetyltransferase
MSPGRNALGQPVGVEVPDWAARPSPSVRELAGRYCRLEKLSAERHARELFTAFSHDADGAMWTYMPYGPFASEDALCTWLTGFASASDPYPFAIVAEGVVGFGAYLRIDHAHGVIEIGHLAYAPALQRTRASTEAAFLLVDHAFELGYRRVEWKCNSLNAASNAAARRLGFTYEGTFRQARVDKGRNRDTAWYGMIDSDWPALREGLLAWLDPANFDGEGRQKAPLAAFRFS